MPGVINSGSGPVFDASGRQIEPGMFIVHPDTELLDTPPVEEGGAEGQGITSTPTAQETGNAAAAAIQALGAKEAVAAIADVTDPAVLNALATDTRTTVAKAATDKLAALS